MIDPGYWQNLAPFDGSTGRNATLLLPPPPSIPGQTVVSTQGVSNTSSQAAAAQNAANQAYAQAQATGVAQPSSTQNPYDWTQAFIEQERSRRQESDRQYQIQLQGLQNQRDQIAISRGQAEANQWYNQQTLLLSQQKLAEDKRQYDITTQEAIRQFNLKQQELARQFDVTTAEGKRQYDQSFAENKRQFDATFGQRATEFQQDLDFRKSQLTEGARQYDLSRGDQLAQFAEQMGLDKAKLAETARQYDLTRADERERFLANLAENQRQFNVNATGYINGQATLEREKWQNQALMDWTDRAIQLASNPADWVKYKQMTMGVADNAGSIPGLAWTEGGQVGNTAFAGNPQPNSLGNVLGQMGVGGQPTSGQPGTPTPGGPQPGAAGGPLTPAEQSRFDQITARQAQQRAAGEALDPNDTAELQRYQARGAQGTGAFGQTGMLNPQEQARYDQIMARQAQQTAAGEALDPSDSAELARYQQRISQSGTGAQTRPTPMSAGAAPTASPAPSAAPTDGSGGYYLRGTPGSAPSGGVADTQQLYTTQTAAPQAAQPVTNWAQQAANMIPSNDQLRASMSPGEQQIWDTAAAFSKNPQQDGGWWQQQDPLTQELIRGASQAQGNDWATVMSRYNRSRWGGGGSARAA